MSIIEKYLDCAVNLGVNTNGIIDTDPMQLARRDVFKQCITADEVTCNTISNGIVTVGLLATMSMGIGAASLNSEYQDCP